MTQQGATALLEDDAGLPLDNPVYTDAYGGYVFNTSEGIYDIEVSYGQRTRWIERNVFIGVDPSDYFRGAKGDPGAGGNVAVGRAQLQAVTATAGDSWYLSEAGREGNFEWVTGNFAARVTADPFQGLYIPSTANPTGSTGCWIRRGHNGVGLATWFGVVADGTTDNGPRLRSAGAQIDLKKIIAPAGVIAVSSSVCINRLEGAGMDITIFRALPNFNRNTFTNGVVVTTEPASDVEWKNFTADANKVGLGLGLADRICPTMLRTVTRANVEFVKALNGTAYGMFGRFTSQARYENCEAYNCQYAFEQLGSNGVYHENCKAGDGDGSIPVSGYFHCAAASNDITWNNCVGEGASNFGVDITMDTGASNNIRFLNGRISTTSLGAGIIIQGTYPATNVDLSGSEFRSQSGLAALYMVTEASGRADAARFFGRARGVDQQSGGLFEFTNCLAEGRLPEVPGNASIGVFTTGSGKIVWNGGSIAAIGGAGDEFISSGNVVISDLTSLSPAPSSRVPANPLTLATGWSTVPGYRPAAWRQSSDGCVSLEGFVSGSGTATTLIATLPAGVRPPDSVAYTVRNGTGAIGFLMISPTGAVELGEGLTTGTATLDGVSFWP
jgi:hypothetical protein